MADRRDRGREAVALDGREHHIAQRLGDRVVEQDAARPREGAAGVIDRFAVAKPLALAGCRGAEQQIAVEAVEVLERVVLATLRGGDRERHQRREPPRLAQIGQLPAALAFRRDHQDTQPGGWQRLEPSEPVGEHAQLAQPLKRSDQTLDRRLDRRRTEPVKVGHAAAGCDAQQPLEPFALLYIEGCGEHAPAALISALARLADEPPQRAPSRQQNPTADQELARPGEQRPAALRRHPGPCPQPRHELGLDSGALNGR